MKTIQNYIEECYKDCFINQKQIPYSDWLIRFNRAIHDFERELVQFVKTNFFLEKIQTNLIANQNTYDLPTWTSDSTTIPWIDQFRSILQVFIKFSDEQKRNFATPMSPTLNENDDEYNSKNITTIKPHFELVNNKIIIYPTPTQNVNNWLSIDFQVMKKDYTLTDDENDLPFPRQDITPVLHKMRVYIFTARWKYQEKADAEADYEKAIKKIFISLSNIYNSPAVEQIPNLSFLTY